MTRLVASIAAVLLATSAMSAQATVLAGPVLPYHNTGWANTGLQLTALQNTTLTSFVFQNYGANDTIRLTSANGTVLQSYTFTGSGTETASTIAVNWALAANTTYGLISVDANNSKYGIAGPMQNADLRVNGGYQLNSSVYTSYWFHFNDLTTATAEVPEPASLALLGLGIAGLAAARRRRAA